MAGIKGEKYINENGEVVLTGGFKTAATNKARHGEDFYKNIGAKGGRAGRGEDYKGGFAGNRELARIAGAKGGRKSRRGPASQYKKGGENE